MVKLSDILIDFFVAILCLAAGFLLMMTFPYVFFLPLIFYALVHWTLKKRKRIAPYIGEEFKAMGYEILSERAPTWKESEIKIKPAILVQGATPISRYGYVRQFHRIFTLKHEDTGLYEVYAVVTRLWNGRNAIEFKNKKRVSS